jgi:hypothetical protein
MDGRYESRIKHAADRLALSKLNNKRGAAARIERRLIISLIAHRMIDEPNHKLFDIVLAVCKKQDGLCMDVPQERYRLARAIIVALHDAGVPMPGTIAHATGAASHITS